MHRYLALSAFLLAGVLSLPALAATVDSVQAPVSLNTGNGFRHIAGTTGAKVGDQVMAGPGGSAKIVYGDGCVEQVDPGTVVTVKEAPPCQVGAHPARPYIIGAAVVGGAVAIGVIVSNNNNGNKKKGNGGGGGSNSNGGGGQCPFPTCPK